MGKHLITFNTSNHPGSMIASGSTAVVREVSQMSAVGTDRLFRPVRKDFRCWRLTGGAAAVPAVGRNRCSSRRRGTVLHQPSDLWLSSSRIAEFGDCLAQSSSKVRGRENSQLMVLD